MRMANLIDENDKWAGGETVVVQVRKGVPGIAYIPRSYVVFLQLLRRNIVNRDQILMSKNTETYRF